MKLFSNSLKNAWFVMLVVVFGLANNSAWAQTSTQNFGTGTGAHASQTGSTAFIPNPTSGTTYARAGAAAASATINLATTSNPLGSSGAFLRAVASTSASISKMSPMVSYTGGTEFYTKFTVLFGDSSASTTASSGVWTFYQGAGANYSDNNDVSTAQVFAGLRFTYGASGALTLTYNNNGTYNSSSLTTSSFAQGTVYTVEIVANNKTSGTISYTYNGVAQTVAVQKFDLFINGTKVGDDLTKGTLGINAAVNGVTFTGVNSTGNAANIFVDDVIVYNAVPASIGTTSTTYYSDGINNDPTVLNNWWTGTGGTGTHPANFTAGDIFVIQTGHAMTNSSAWAVTGASGKIQIQTNATLQANALVVVPNFQVDVGGRYFHNVVSGTVNGASSDIPGSTTRSFGTNSTVEIQSWANGGSAPASLPGVTWGNLTINVASLGGTWAQAGSLTNIRGNFTVKATGGSANVLNLATTQVYTLGVGGDVLIQGGVLSLVSSSGNAILNLASNLTISGGKLDVASGTTSGFGSFINLTNNLTISGGTNDFSYSGAASFSQGINVYGNVTISSGAIDSTGGYVTQIYFAKAGTQTYTGGGYVKFVWWYVNSGATLDLGTGTLTENVLPSGNVFTLNSGGGLITANPAGVSTNGGCFGNNMILSLSTAGNYTFNGSSAQVSGAQLPTVVNNFTNNNSAGLILSSSTVVSNALTLAAGIIDTAASNVVLIASNNIFGGSSTAYVNGKLARYYSSTAFIKTFPIGKNGNYRPVTFNYTALTGTSTVTAEQIDPGAGFGGSSPSVTPFTSRYWTVTQSGASVFTYSITLDGTGFSPTGVGVILKYNNPTTTKLTASFSSPNYTAAGLTSFSDFALGDDNTGTPPAISVQPTSRTNNYNTTATFTVSATGTAPLSYQWYLGSVSPANAVITDGVHIGGSTNSTIGFTNVLAGDAGGYLVVITNSAGSITSSVATLTVNDPFIVTQPVSFTNLYQASGSFSVSASGSGSVTYQWRTNNVNVVSGGRFSGATSATLGISGLVLTDTNWNYTVVVSGAGLSVTSSIVKVSVTNAPAQYRSKTSGNWNVTSTWEESLDSGTTWVDAISTPTSSDFTNEVRSGHFVTNTASITVDQVVVDNGGTLVMSTAFTVANGAGDDILVQSGGVWVLNTSTSPTFNSGSTAKIETGGILRIGVTGITGSGATIHSANVIYQTGSILECAITSISSSGITYFPNVDANTIPIFRQTVSISAGANSPTVFNGMLEVASGATFLWSGTASKTFRNGIRGAGDVNQGTSGLFIISGATADLGGSGTLTLTNGLQISSGSVTTLSSDKPIAGTGIFTNAGTLDLSTNTLTFTTTAPRLSGTLVQSVDNGDVNNNSKLVLSTGNISYGGNLTVSNVGPALAGGEVFDLFDAAGFSGSFVSTNLPTLANGLNWYLGNLAVNGSIKVNHAPTASADIYTNVATLLLKIPIASLTNNDADADGDVFTLTGINLTTTNGVVMVTNSTFIFYTNALNVPDEFTYTISDSFGGSSTGKVSIAVITSVTGQATGIISTGGNSVTVSFAGRPTWPYGVQRTTNLVDWITISTTNAPAGGLFNYTDNFNDLGYTPPSAYYRLNWTAP